MPHLILEYTANLEPDFNADETLDRLHEVFGACESVDIARLKSRAVRYDRARVGASGDKMVHVTLRLLEGRSAELREQISDAVYVALKSCITDPAALLTLEYVEMEKASYRS